MRNDIHEEIEQLIAEVQQSTLPGKRKIEQLLSLCIVISDEQRQTLRSLESILS